MIPSSVDAVFYIQASAATGMGHIVRSAALVKMLGARGLNCCVVLRVDAQGHALARENMLTAHDIDVRTVMSLAAPVIIDAVIIPANDALYLSKSPQRILISPVCDRADIATHALVRSVPDALRGTLANNCSLTRDDRYAYATAAGLTPRALDYGRLIVGICLSGGVGQPSIDSLVQAVRGVPGLDAVHVIHPNRPNTSGYGAEVYHRTFCEDPWAFLAPINVFIGGDGVMIAEAVAQGLPCLSITRPDLVAKNRTFIDAGCVDYCYFDDAPVATLTAFLSDRERLTSMHRAAIETGAGQTAGALADEIAHLVNEERS